MSLALPCRLLKYRRRRGRELGANCAPSFWVSQRRHLRQLESHSIGGCMTIADKAVLVTGANRGIGQALVAEALSRGVKRVYAVTRRPVTHSDSRVTPVTLDVTNAAQIQRGRSNRIARHPRQQRRVGAGRRLE